MHSGSVVTAYSESRLRLAAEVLDDDGDVEFLPFGDLVGQVLRMAGERHERLVTRGQREAMTVLACDSLTGDSALERAAKLPGMAKLMGERADELRHFGIGAGNLRAAASTVPLDLARKLETLAETFELVQDSMDVSHRETVTDRIQQCLEIGHVDCGPVSHVVVITGPEEFPDFDSWVLWLGEQGVEVDVLSEAVPGRADLFAGSQRGISRFRVKKAKVVGARKWYEALFSGEVASEHPEIEVFSAADPLGECEWIVRRCLALSGEGAPLKKIGVYVRDAGHYAPLLVASADRLGLSMDSTRSVPLLTSGLAGVVLEALKACASPDVRHVARLGKNSYCLTTPDAFWELWDQASKLSRGGRDGWTALAKWLEQGDLELPWLRSIIAWRSEVSQDSAKLSTWLERLRTFVGDTAIADASALSDPTVVPRDLRAQTVLQRSIADMAFVYDQAGHRELSLAEFVRLAEHVWRDETITVRTEIGGVVVCHDAASLPCFDVLFVPGMLEGTLPKRRSEDPILSDEERALLSEHFGVRLPNSRDEARAERDNFVRICAAARRKLVLSYPITDTDRENVPAFYLEELKRAVNGEVALSMHPRRQFAPAPSDCVSAADQRLRAALDQPRDYPVRPRLTEPWAQECLKPDWEKGTPPEEFGAALTCPFQAAFLYRLDVKSPLRRIGTWILLDLPRRARLAQSPSKETALESLSANLEELLDGVAPNLEAWEVELLRATGKRFIHDWVDREFRSREIWPRDSSLSDVPLGEEGLKDSPTIEGRKLKLSGKAVGLTSVCGVSVVQSYDGYPFKADRFEEGVETTESDFVRGLYLMCQYGRSPAGTALEIDSATGERILAVLSAGRLGLRSDQGIGLAAKSLGESPPRVFRAIKDRLKEATLVLEAATAEPRPGEHCTRCRYGELCRVSAEFGEEASPFGEDEDL